MVRNVLGRGLGAEVMNPIILYRSAPLMESVEYEAMKASGVRHTDSRVSVRPGDMVIGRYSVLPYYREVEKDVTLAGGAMINSYRQHRYVADIGNWYPDLEGITPRTWSSLEIIDEPGPFIVKGETTSRRNKWRTHMYAEDMAGVRRVISNLFQDEVLHDQHLYIREYVPLVRLCESEIGACPISKEFRFFVLYGNIICGGFYWRSHVEDIGSVPDPSEVPETFLREVTSRIGLRCPFYTVDVGQLTDGSWIVIELNDGQMSGLSECDPGALYRALSRV